MQESRLKALKNKHEKLERHIQQERAGAAGNDVLINRIKKEKLHLKEEIARLQDSAGE
ncbi:MAG: YdcH family protein [Proteobacteria bacterium]|nr:YdcH family protein [Pseudomonadota bacterium]